MNRKNLLITIAVALVIGTLFYLQFRAWKDFDWAVFMAHTRAADLTHLLTAAGLIYFDYFLRAWRWEVMMRPTRDVKITSLIAPTIIGFTGVAFLGRPGEFIRPYLISKKEDVPVSSQLAVWTVERIFDTALFTVFVAATIFFAPSLRQLPFFGRFQEFGFVMVLMVALMGAFAVLIRKRGDAVAGWTEVKLSRFSRRVAGRVAKQIRAYSEGLNTLRDGRSFIEIVLLSALIWAFIAFAYREVTLAYPEPLAAMPFSHVVLLMGFAIAGSAVQLPMVGGGAQLVSIAALAYVFKVPHELAVSCGIMLWLITFMVVIPAGLILARFEHVSLRRLSQESRAK